MVSIILAKKINAATSALGGTQLRLSLLTRAVLGNRNSLGVLSVDQVKSVQLLIQHTVAK